MCVRIPNGLRESLSGQQRSVIQQCVAGLLGLPRERSPLRDPRDFAPHVWRSFQAYPLCQHDIGLAQTPEAEALSDPPTFAQILRSDVGFTFLCFI